MKIYGHNDFYSGWLHRVLLQQFDAGQSDAWRDGWFMADETGDDAIGALQAEIRMRHVLVDAGSEKK